MDALKRMIVLFLLLVGLLVISACGGGGGGGNGGGGSGAGPTLGTVITSPSVSFIIGWGQSVPLMGGPTGTESPGVFPGQANKWDLAMDFSLEDGGDNQFDYALAMDVDSSLASEEFPFDQSYGELVFMTPMMGASSGVKAAAVSDGTGLAYSALTGTYSAYLNATSDSRLQQTLVLTGATGTITATWNDSIHVCDGSLFNITGYTPSYRVVARDTAGTELAELFSATGAAFTDATTRSADLSSFASQTVILSFEQKSLGESYQDCYTIIDDVSVADSAVSPNEFVTNGGFETADLTGWTDIVPSESQNVTSGMRSVGGLDVTRTFYTSPDKLWGRWTDLFVNSTASSVTATVHYYTSLGSNGYGIVYDTPGAGGKALTAWDGATGDRDVGLVFGNAASVSYLSDDGLGNGHGDSLVEVEYGITVPAGGKAAIVNFIVMDGTDTGMLSSTTDTTARAAEIDTAAAAIASDFLTDTQYRDGMTQEQIDAIRNF